MCASVEPRVKNERRESTLHDVALLAGVSTATASRVLNGSDRRVTEANQARVRRAASMLQYAPNESAQSIALGSTRNIGLVVRNIAEPYFASIASGVLEEAEALRMRVSIAVTSDDLDREVDHVHMFRRQRAAAVILVGSRHTTEPRLHDLVAELERVEDAGGRVVLLTSNSLPFDTVSIDNQRGAMHLTETLVALGYERFIAVAGPAHYVTAQERLNGVRQGLAGVAAKVAHFDILESRFDWQGGFDAASAVPLRELSPRTVIVAANDLVALGLLTGLRERGIEVPRDVALTGFDDISTLRDVTPLLTTVRVPLSQAGRTAVRIAMSSRQGDRGTEAAAYFARYSTSVPTTVVIRNSTPRYNQPTYETR